MRELLRGFADRGGTVLLSSHLLAEVEAVADRMIIIGGGRIQAQGTRAELLTASPGPSSRPTTSPRSTPCFTAPAWRRTPPTAIGGWSRPSPRSSPALAMANDVVLRRLAPADEAGLERLFFELTTSGGSAPSPKTDPIHPELAGATA